MLVNIAYINWFSFRKLLGGRQMLALLCGKEKWGTHECATFLTRTISEHIGRFMWDIWSPGASSPLDLLSSTWRWASQEHNRENDHQLWERCAGRDGFPKRCHGEHDNASGPRWKCFDTNVTFSHLCSSPVEQSFASLGKVLGTFVPLCDATMSPPSWAKGELVWKRLSGEVRIVLHLCKVGFGVYHIKVFKFMKQILGAQLIPWVTFLQNQQLSCCLVSTG